MPEIRIDDIKKQLKANKPSKLYLIYGKDAYLKRQAAGMLIDFLTPDMLPELNVERVDMQRSDLPHIIESVWQYPQMAERRCVVAENFTMPLGQKQCEDFYAQLSDLPDTGVLILWTGEEDIPSATMRKLADVCAKNGSVLKAEPLKPADIRQILLSHAEEAGAKLRPAEADYLIQRCGADSLMLLGQLDKLIAYAGRKSITKEMIDALTPATLEVNAFKIAQNILSGRRDEAFRIVGALLEAREDPMSIYARLTGNFIDLYRAKAAVQSGISSAEIVESFPGDYGGKKSFRIENAMRDCGRYSLSALREYVDLLLNAELEMKSTGSNNAVSLEKLITRLCLAGERKS